MIVDREKEIEKFVPEKYWQLGVITEKSGEQIEARTRMAGSRTRQLLNSPATGQETRLL